MGKPKVIASIDTPKGSVFIHHHEDLPAHQYKVRGLGHESHHDSAEDAAKAMEAHAEKHGWKRPMKKSDLWKAEKDAIDEYMKAEKKSYGEFMAKNATKQWEHTRLKGVHTSGGFSSLEEEGRSQAGNEITSRAPKASNKYLRDMHHERGKDMHREKLQELKDMPKPSLPKSELFKAEKDAIDEYMKRKKK